MESGCVTRASRLKTCGFAWLPGLSTITPGCSAGGYARMSAKSRSSVTNALPSRLHNSTSAGLPTSSSSRSPSKMAVGCRTQCGTRYASVFTLSGYCLAPISSIVRFATSRSHHWPSRGDFKSRGNPTQPGALQPYGSRAERRAADGSAALAGKEHERFAQSHETAGFPERRAARRGPQCRFDRRRYRLTAEQPPIVD